MTRDAGRQRPRSSACTLTAFPTVRPRQRCPCARNTHDQARPRSIPQRCPRGHDGGRAALAHPHALRRAATRAAPTTHSAPSRGDTHMMLTTRLQVFQDFTMNSSVAVEGQARCEVARLIADQAREPGLYSPAAPGRCRAPRGGRETDLGGRYGSAMNATAPWFKPWEPRTAPARPRRAAGIPVTCNECGRKFSTRSMSPSCPKCGGSDVDVR